MKQTFSLKTTWVKAINKSIHLKVIDRHFLLKIKKTCKRGSSRKIAVGRKTSSNFSKKTPSPVTFTKKVAKKIVKFCRVCKLTEAVIVNVKINFTLNQDKGMRSLKILDNVCSLEFLMNASTIVFRLAKLKQSTKYILKVGKKC